MTREEISTFRTGDGFYELRFSEAEMRDAFNGGFLDAIDRALEIIDKLDAEAVEDFELDTDYGLAVVHERFGKARKKIAALKGGKKK